MAACPRSTCEYSSCVSLVFKYPLLIAVYRDDWTKFTDYRGYEKTDQVIEWFWQCIRSWPDERKARLLQFTTGTSRVPVNGFKDLQGSDGPRRFTIEKSGDPSGLPRSHTCFNRLDLPPYTDYESLEQKLLFAIECVAVFLFRSNPILLTTTSGKRKVLQWNNCAGLSGSEAPMCNGHLLGPRRPSCALSARAHLRILSPLPASCAMFSPCISPGFLYDHFAC